MFLPGFLHPTLRMTGLEGPALEVPHQGREVRLAVGVKQVDAHLVDPRCASVPLDGLEGLSHQLGGNSPRERMHLDLLHGEPFMRCNHGIRLDRPLGDVP